jgi:hypothetical protein
MFWSYYMPAHLDAKHQGLAIPADFEVLYSVSQDECIRLRVEKGKVAEGPVKRGTKCKELEVEAAAQTSIGKKTHADRTAVGTE